MDPIKLYFVNKFTASQWKKEYDADVWTRHINNVVGMNLERSGKPDFDTVMMDPKTMKAYRKLLSGPAKTKVRKRA